MKKTFQRSIRLRKQSLIGKDNVDDYGFAIKVEK